MNVIDQEISMSQRGSMIQGVLFDKDGTLVDFRLTWLPAYRALARELAGLALPGKPEPAIADLEKRILLRLGYDLATSAFAPASPLLWATNAVLADLLADQTELRGLNAHAVARAHLEDVERYPAMPVGDLRALFERLCRRGMKLGIATMDSTCSAGDLAARFQLCNYLSFVAGCDAGHGHKPASGMVDGFCRATGLLAEEVVVIGDTLADLAMARNAGTAAALAVLTGALPAQVLAPHADAVLPDIHHLEAWLDAHPRGLPDPSAAANYPATAPR